MNVFQSNDVFRSFARLTNESDKKNENELSVLGVNSSFSDSSSSSNSKDASKIVKLSLFERNVKKLIENNYKDKTAIIIQGDPEVIDEKKKNFIVYQLSTVGQIISSLRVSKTIKLKPSESIFIFLDSKLVSMNDVILDLDMKYSDLFPGGILVFYLKKETCFGSE